MPHLVPQREDFELAAKQIIAEASPAQIINGAGKAIATENNSSDTSRMSVLLDNAGLTREEIAFQLRILALSAEKEETKHQVLKTALQLHGELKDQEVKAGININIIGADSTLMNVLMPR